MRHIFAICLLLAAPAAFADIIIGQSAPLSGANADLGNDIRKGAEAYFKKVNDTGGVRGQKIKLVTLDDKNDTKLSAENTKKLVADENTVALFGYASSTLSIPAMPSVVAGKIPFFAPFTGADAIRKQNDYVYTIRATYADEIDKIINFWGGLGFTRVVVLHYDDAVGKDNFATVARTLEKFGKQPTAVAIKRNTDVSDTDIAKIIAADPQMIMVTTLYAPAAQMVKKLQKANKPYSVTSLSFVGASQLAKALGPDAAGITVGLTVPAPKTANIPVVKECGELWTAIEPSEPMSVTALEGCIAAKILVEGIKKVNGNVTRDSLHKSLSALTKVDVGGFEVVFKPGFHHGGKFVDIAVIRANGELRS